MGRERGGGTGGWGHSLLRGCSGESEGTQGAASAAVERGIVFWGQYVVVPVQKGERMPLFWGQLMMVLLQPCTQVRQWLRSVGGDHIVSWPHF